MKIIAQIYKLISKLIIYNLNTFGKFCMTLKLSMNEVISKTILMQKPYLP
jgi:hypothetical protein